MYGKAEYSLSKKSHYSNYSYWIFFHLMIRKKNIPDADKEKA